MTDTTDDAVTLESLRDYMEMRARECDNLLMDNAYRAPEHPAKLKPEVARITGTRRRLYDELVAIIDEGKFPS